MGRLNPSHPISRFAPEGFRDRIDVIGTHLVWTGAFSTYAKNNQRGRGPAFTHEHANRCAARLAWEYATGETLSNDDVLWSHCSLGTGTCIAPACHEKITRHEALKRMAANSHRKKGHRVHGQPS